MSPRTDAAAWKRLGELLIRRRIELDPAYQNRTAFCTERGIDYRLAYDIEEARRTNFRKGTLAGIAAAYGVTLDSLYAALGGGELAPALASRAAQTRPLHAVPDSSDHSENQAGTDPAESLLAALVKMYGEGDDQDSNVVRLLANQFGHGKPAATIVREIREWLRVTGQTERNGTSA